jgi:hypothetical protein
MNPCFLGQCLQYEPFKVSFSARGRPRKDKKYEKETKSDLIPIVGSNNL